MLHVGLRICLLITGGCLCAARMHTMHCLWHGGELHDNSAVFIERASEPVVGKHLWASNLLTAKITMPFFYQETMQPRARRTFRRFFKETLYNRKYSSTLSYTTNTLHCPVTLKCW
jgi:hypothetical protein